jgi:G3E family GTPase
MLAARLRTLNGRADIIKAAQGEVDPRWILAEGAGAHAGFVAEEAGHSDGIASFTIVETRPIAWSPFACAMEALIALRGADLLRVKGILDVAFCRGPVVVQIVQHLAHPPVELDCWPDSERRSRIVFIARNLTAQVVTDLFAAMRAVG